ncbi:hypothetical protein Mapa_004900 [Marchantia paleacea]|nr:hypothetical protein Mapa_004900 [Marchantia paleacea]
MDLCFAQMAMEFSDRRIDSKSKRLRGVFEPAAGFEVARQALAGGDGALQFLGRAGNCRPSIALKTLLQIRNGLGAEPVLDVQRFESHHEPPEVRFHRLAPSRSTLRGQTVGDVFETSTEVRSSAKYKVRTIRRRWLAGDVEAFSLACESE